MKIEAESFFYEQDSEFLYQNAADRMLESISENSEA